MNSEIRLVILQYFGKIRSIWAFILILLFTIVFSWFPDSLYEIVKSIKKFEKTDILCFLFFLFLSIFLIFSYNRHVAYNRKNKDIKDYGFSDYVVYIAFIAVCFISLFYYFFVKGKLILAHGILQFFISFNFFLLAWVIIRDINWMGSFSVKQLDKDLFKFKGLIIFLSVIKEDDFDNILKRLEHYGGNGYGESKIQNKFSEIFQGIRFSWEMQVRIIENYKDNLQFIYIIGSKSGSYELIEKFKQLIHLLGYYNLKFIKLEGPIDFEDMKENIEAIESAYKKLKEEGIKDDEILIDITGGQKIQSAAGAFCALAKDRYFCYISTNDKNIKIYDVIYIE